MNSSLQPSQPSKPSQLSEWLSVRFHRQDESESFASWNVSPEPVWCLDPGCVRNAPGTLRSRSYADSRYDCSLLIAVENGIRIVVTVGIINGCAEPVERID
jgi:hypothetical protein